MKGLSHPGLMRASEWRVEQAAASSSDPQLKLVASRVLDDPGTRRLWELEHTRYMRVVAGQRRHERQRAALRLLAFRLIHRKAMFTYLRGAAIRGDERRRVVALLHGSRAYSDAVVAEHQLFIRSAASHLCTTHISCSIVGDPAFDELFVDYERSYLEYFALFCQVQTVLTDDALLERELLPCLKLSVTRQRAAILTLDGAPSARWRPLAVSRGRRKAVAPVAGAPRLGPAYEPTALQMYA